MGKFPFEEVEHQARYLPPFVLKGEMPRIQKVDFGIGKIALIRMCALGGKDLIVAAPYDQGRRFALAKELLKLRIEADVGTVVVEEVELNVHVARTIQPGLVEEPRGGIDSRRIADAIHVL